MENLGEKIVEIAMAEIGTKENPINSNKTKYGEWFGWNGVMWCGIFVSYCYFLAGKPLRGYGWLKGFAGCQQTVSLMRKKKLEVLEPQEGDIVFFDWEGDGRYDHTGIFVRKLNDLEFESIEGNTSINNQSNGGEVMLRRRKFKQSTFFRP